MVGGTGCISSGVVKACLDKGYEVAMINRGNRPHLIPECVYLIKADKDNLDAIAEQIGDNRFDAVVDFLCYNNKELEKSIRFYSKYAPQYVFISSCAVFDGRKSNIIDENSPMGDERWSYSISKMKAEALLKQLAENMDVKYTIVRPNVTYGDTRIPYGITPPYGKHGTIIQRILHGKPIIRWEKGETFSNMMRVEDFSKAFVELLGNPLAYNNDFNICSGNNYTFNDVLEILERKLGKEIVVFDVTGEEYAQKIPYRRGELISGRCHRNYHSMDKFKSLFPDFKEEYNLRAGIEKTIDAYFAQNWMDGMSYEFDAECDRIIRDISRKRRESKDKYRLGFIDYLGKGNPKDRKTYKSSLNANKFYNRLYRSLRYRIGRLLRH